MGTTYTILGTTDERTECENCSKTGLKKTVVLSNGERTMFVGVCCASKLMGRSERYISRVSGEKAHEAMNELSRDEWDRITESTHYRLLKNSVGARPMNGRLIAKSIARITEQTGIDSLVIVHHVSGRWNCDISIFLVD